MGSLAYGSGDTTIEFDDRALAHLQIVIIAKLRRHESFLFSWVNPMDAGSGRGGIWLSSTSTLSFKFSGNRQPTINKAWAEALMRSANSATGLLYTPEPTETPNNPNQPDKTTARA
jgi:hypothetical protein